MPSFFLRILLFLSCLSASAESITRCHSCEGENSALSAAITAGLTQGALGAISSQGSDAAQAAQAAQSAAPATQGAQAAAQSGTQLAVQAKESVFSVANISTSMQEHVARSLVSSTVRHAFGEKQAYSHILRDTVANIIGSLGARGVGDLRVPTDGTAGIDAATRNLLHFCNSAISGSIKGGTACTVAGGVAGMVSEMVGDAVYDGTNLEIAARIGEIAGSVSGIVAGNGDVGSMTAHNTI